MKVIFLDIDGVLNSRRSSIAFNGMPWPDHTNDVWEEKFDHIAIGLLRDAIEKTNAVCVLSSTWRYDGSELVQRLARFLQVPIIGVTRSLSMTRGDEIKEWLDNHKEVTHYAILDDSSDMLPYQKKNLVHVNSMNGMSYENYMDLIKVLSD